MSPVVGSEPLDPAPSLPELDAVARRASASARSTSDTFAVAMPTSNGHRRRVLQVAAVVAFLWVVVAVVVVARHNLFHQQPATSPPEYVFPSVVPTGLGFLGYEDVPDHDLFADQPDPSDVPVHLYVSATGTRGLAVFAGELACGCGGLFNTNRPYPRSTAVRVGGRSWYWSHVGGGIDQLSLDDGHGAQESFVAIGLSEAQVLAVAASATYPRQGPPHVSPKSVPAGWRRLADTDEGELFMATGEVWFADEPGRTLTWQGAEKTLRIVTQAAPRDALAVDRLLLGHAEPIMVHGQPGLVGSTSLPSDSAVGATQVVWVEHGQRVIVVGTGLTRAEVRQVAASIRTVDEAGFGRLLAAHGGPMGEPEHGSTVIGHDAANREWRMVVYFDGEGRAGLDISGPPGSPGGAASNNAIVSSASTPPLDLFFLTAYQDHRESPTVLAGRTATRVARVLVGSPGRPVRLVTVRGRQYFAVAVAPHRPVTVVAYAANGEVVGREVLSHP